MQPLSVILFLGLQAHHIVAICTALLVKSIIVLTWFMMKSLFERNKKRSKTIAFENFLHHFGDFCLLHYKHTGELFDKYSTTKGNEFEGRSIVNSSRSHINSIVPDLLFKEYSILLTNEHAQHISSTLVEILYQLKFRNESLDNFLVTFSQEYTNCLGEYRSNIYDLSRMHDELKRQVKNATYDKPDDGWEKRFVNIFDQWFRNGAKKDMLILEREIIEKILALGKLYPANANAARANEKAMACERAFLKVLKLDDDISRKLKEYIWAYRRAARISLLIARRDHAPAGSRFIVGSFSPILMTKKFSLRERIIVCSGVLLISAICFAGGFYFDRLKYDHTYKVAAGSIHSITGDTILHKSVAVTEHKTAVDSFAALDTVSAVYGLDISRYQGNLLNDINRMDTLHFIICKATQGQSLVDADFIYNWQRLKKMRIIRGAYHFYMAKDEPALQAQHFLKTVGTLGDIDIPLIVDIEKTGMEAGTTAESLQPALLTFLLYIKQRTGKKPLIYTNLYFANTYLRQAAFADYPLWLAEYSHRPSPVLPLTWKQKGSTFWQKNDTLTIDSRKTDFDVFAGNGAMFMEFIRRGTASN